LHRGYFRFRSSVAVFYRPVVAKEGDIVDRGFNPQHQPLFIVEFNGNRPHVVLDPGSLDTGVKIMFIFITPVQLSAQKGGHVIGLDGVDGRLDAVSLPMRYCSVIRHEKGKSFLVPARPG